MKQLLDGKYSPITYKIGFLKASFEETWQFVLRNHLKNDRTFEAADFADTLSRALLRLEPLKESRKLVAETQSDWTALFCKDPLPIIDFASQKLKKRGLCVTWAEHTFDPKTRTGVPGSLQLFVLRGVDDSSRSFERVISLTYDWRHWVFHDEYPALPFERISIYKSRNMRDRLTPELLNEYCSEMGIRFCDDTFYGPRFALLQSRRCSQGIGSTPDT